MNLFRRLKRFLWPPPIAAEVHHDRLGVITLTEDGWITSVRHADQELYFSIGGKSAPDPMCLQQVVDIVANLDEFLTRIQTFLREEARKQKSLAEEIAQLRLEYVCFFWPKRPNHGSLFFAGPDEKAWHCDYTGGRLQFLGFDN
jgi:hypothetical protein